MNPRDTKPTAADNPTGEEEALEVDGTSTDQLDSRYRVRVVTASEAVSGTVEFDDRGQPRWKYNDNQPTRDPETTFDLLKALENAAIAIEEPAPPEPKPEFSFDPYDRGTTKPGRTPG
jgi:hypothetical protein